MATSHQSSSSSIVSSHPPPHKLPVRSMAASLHLAVTGSLKELVDQGVSTVPSKYIFPSHLKSTSSSPKPRASPPVIDLALLKTPDRPLAVAQIGEACRDYGLFQVINHGVPLSLLESLSAAAERFFSLPVEQRLPYLMDDPRDKRTARANWKETISFGSASSAPAFCMEPAVEYKAEVKKLSETLYTTILESLGNSVDEEKAKQHMASCNMLMHYYPPCPDPSLTFGLSEHTDAGFITVLLQGRVGGLEILKDGHWIACDPVPNALTINIADQMEILSNGRYASALHRVVTNGEKPRLSMPCFVAPSMDGTTCPLPHLIDGNNPALYKEVVFRDYFQHYMKVRIEDTATSGLDFARL